MVKVKTEGLSFVMNTDNHYLGVCGISCCEFNTDFLLAGLVEHQASRAAGWSEALINISMRLHEPLTWIQAGRTSVKASAF